MAVEIAMCNGIKVAGKFRCPSCGEYIKNEVVFSSEEDDLYGIIFCTFCKVEIELCPIRCISCGSTLDMADSWKYCPYCSAEILPIISDEKVGEETDT